MQLYINIVLLNNDMSENNILQGNSIQSLITILVFITGTIASLYGFSQWVDERYASTEKLYRFISTVGVAMYDHRIDNLKNERRFLLREELENNILGNTATNKDFRTMLRNKIDDLNKRIIIMSKNRTYFLDTGHYIIGDSIILNARTKDK